MPITKEKYTMDMHIAHIVDTLDFSLCGYLHVTSISNPTSSSMFILRHPMNLRSDHPTRWSSYPLVCPPERRYGLTRAMTRLDNIDVSWVHGCVYLRSKSLTQFKTEQYLPSRPHAVHFLQLSSVRHLSGSVLYPFSSLWSQHLGERNPYLCDRPPVQYLGRTVKKFIRVQCGHVDINI
jgi:hypothetical protein